MGRRFIFPFKVMPWDSLANDAGEKLTAGSQMKAVGFIPVYEDVSTFADDHGTDCPCGTFVESGDTFDESPETQPAPVRPLRGARPK